MAISTQDWNDNKPFSSLKVLDLSGILAGPLTASFFAELGAKVIKIENKLTKGDATRQWKLPTEDKSKPVSAYYHSANYGKEVLMLDLNVKEERELVSDLLKESDIVISNFQKETAQKFDLCPEGIFEKNKHLIVAQLNAFHFDDPRPGYDLVMQGETGWIGMNGTDDDHLAKIPVAIIDIFAAHQLKEAILIALWKKAMTGRGSIIHVSLYKSGITGLANQAANYLNLGHLPKPIGTLHPNIAPYGEIFTSLDEKKFILAVGSDAQFKKLWFTLNLHPEKIVNFELNSDRVAMRSALQEILQHQFAIRSFEEIRDLLDKIQLPYCSILSMKEVFENDLAKKMVLSSGGEGEKMYSVSSIAFEIIE
jgi:crotonobetainyl-CoA:carnitine CoA-transferase CaiB-like acyl-CoA transferase